MTTGFGALAELLARSGVSADEMRELSPDGAPGFAEAAVCGRGFEGQVWGEGCEEQGAFVVAIGTRLNTQHRPPRLREGRSERRHGRFGSISSWSGSRDVALELKERR